MSKFTFGKNGMLKKEIGRKAKLRAKRLFNQRIKKRKNWIDRNPELAEKQRIDRIESYLKTLQRKEENGTNDTVPRGSEKKTI